MPALAAFPTTSAVHPEYRPVIPFVFNVSRMILMGPSFWITRPMHGLKKAIARIEWNSTYLASELGSRFNKFGRICHEPEFSGMVSGSAICVFFLEVLRFDRASSCSSY
jgi:hypothetical protein